LKRRRPETLVFDTSNDPDQNPDSYGYIALFFLSGGQEARLAWDGTRFTLETEDRDGVWSTEAAFYDADLPAGNRWITGSYAFPDPVEIAGIGVADRGGGPWPLASCAYTSAAVTLDFPEHALDKGNPHDVNAEQAGTYTKAVIDAKDSALANLTYYYRAYWFGRRDPSTPWPQPPSGETWDSNSRNGFDFSTNTPWTRDGSQWAEGTPVTPGRGTVIGVSSAFLDIAEAGFAGLARYSEESGDWDYYPDIYNTMDPLIFERNALGQETVKAGGIRAAHISAAAREEMLLWMFPPGQISDGFFREEAVLSQWRLLPADGRTIPAAEALADTAITGMYRTSDDWANGAAAAASGKDRATPDAGGMFFAIPDLRGLFRRGAGQNAFRKCANGTPYDGGAVGSVGLDRLSVHGHNFSNFHGANQGLFGEIHLRITTGSNGVSDGAAHVAAGDAVQTAWAAYYIAGPNGVRQGNETAPVWMASSVYMTY
jgi:hypothetical protein